MLEVIIAATIFTIVIAITLQHLCEIADVSTVTTLQADLRRTGQDVLARMAEDLRATQARSCSFTQDTIELTRIVGFDPSTGTPVLENDPAGDPIYIRYTSPLDAVTPDGRYGVLRMKKVASARMGSAPWIELSRELDRPPAGFTVTALQGLAGGGAALLPATDLLSLAPANHLPNQPTLLRITLALQRRIGMAAAGEQFVKATLSTEIQLRADGGY